MTQHVFLLAFWHSFFTYSAYVFAVILVSFCCHFAAILLSFCCHFAVIFAYNYACNSLCVFSCIFACVFTITCIIELRFCVRFLRRQCQRKRSFRKPTTHPSISWNVVLRSESRLQKRHISFDCGVSKISSKKIDTNLSWRGLSDILLLEPVL